MKTTLILLCALFLFACGGAGKNQQKERRLKRGELGRVDEGARCNAELGRESLVDLNNDGVPDVRMVYKNDGDDEVMICREADLNFDGTKDFFIFFDDKGQIVRDESDLDFDRRIDIIATYARGKVVKKEYDTNSDGLVDRVRYIQNDLPIRMEGDRDGDGKVDLWEYYAGGKLVRVGEDEDGDGRADVWSRDGQTESSLIQEKDAEGDGAESTEASKTKDGEDSKKDSPEEGEEGNAAGKSDAPEKATEPPAPKE